MTLDLDALEALWRDQRYSQTHKLLDALPELIRLARIGQRILSLPIQGEATNPGEQVVRDAHTEDGSKHCVEPARPGPSQECVIVPVEELKIVLDFFRKANWPDTRAGNAAYRLNSAMLAAAKEE